MEQTRRVIQTTADFGQALRAARRERYLTQQKAAELTGVSARLWNETERGKRNQIGLDTALRMLQTLGLDLSIESRAQRSGTTR
ncbi:MAG: helix-turn-helix domain-containing protein [Gemmatimonadaceae bacterium]